MFRVLAQVCGISVLFTVAWMPTATGAWLPKCNGKASIVLAVPGGNGLPSKVLETNLIDLMYHFNIDRDNIKIGLLLYGEASQPILYPTDYQTRTLVNTKVTMLSQRSLYYSTLRQSQNLVRGLEKMEDMFDDVDEDDRKIGVVFTENQINSTEKEGHDILEVASRLQDSGVMMYNLGASVSPMVGSVFEKIGTDRCRLFSMNSFKQSLPFAIPFLVSGICSELDPNLTVKEGNCFPQRFAKIAPLKLECPSQPHPFYNLYRDPNNCADYFQCQPTQRKRGYDGRAQSIPIRRRCGTGTLFNGYICNYINMVPCY